MEVSLEEVAKALGVEPGDLLGRSLQAFLRSELRKVNAEIGVVYGKYGVGSLDALDRLINEGKVGESDAFEDFTRLDYLEERRDMLSGLLRRIG